MRSGGSFANDRHEAIEREGKRISSLRRVKRSSLMAKTRRPSCNSAAPASWPSHTPSTFTAKSTSLGWLSKEQISDERPAVARSTTPDADMGGPVHAWMLVAGNFGHSESAPQRLDDHFLFD